VYTFTVIVVTLLPLNANEVVDNARKQHSLEEMIKHKVTYSDCKRSVISRINL